MSYRYSDDLRKRLYRIALVYALAFGVIFLFILYADFRAGFLICLPGCILPLRCADVRSQKYRLDSDSLSVYRYGKERSVVSLAKVECIAICRQELPLTEGSHGGGNLVSDGELSIVLLESDNVDFILKHIHEACPNPACDRNLAYTNRAFEARLGWPRLYTCHLDKRNWKKFLSTYDKTVIVPKSLYDANIRELLGAGSKIFIDELF